MRENMITEMNEIELQAQFDMTNIEGMNDYHKALQLRNNLKKIDKYQSTFEYEHGISKEDWENTTFSVKMAMIYMHEEQYTVEELQEQLSEWLNTCPI